VYKLLLCWRYLLTRYLALACIVSVMLGVATLIVVNSVMGGFSAKLRERLHGLLSDVVIEANSLEGFANPRWHMKKIMDDPFLRDRVVVMTPTMEVFAMFQFKVASGESVTRAVRLIGIDMESRIALGGFKEHLEFQENASVPSFEPSAQAKQLYLLRNPLSAEAVQPGLPLPAQWPEPGSPVKNPALPKAQLLQPVDSDPDAPAQPSEAQKPDGVKLPDAPPGVPPEQQVPAAPAGERAPPPRVWDQPPKVPQGVIVGHLIAHIRLKAKNPGEVGEEQALLRPGDEVRITTVKGNLTPAPDTFLVTDYFKSEMSEYDSNYVFVPLEHLQEMRGMHDRVTSIQIRLKNYDEDAKAVVERLKELFPSNFYWIDTWEGKQGPLLGAIQIEKGILNVLLFLIIAVAGFGILAIFSMIVAEKTRDIGILKALGASNRGVMMIFLCYGLLLGLVGAGLGTILGVSLTTHINEVEKALSYLTGNNVFNREIYYFNEIPTDIQFWNVVFLNLGAVAIAVFFSVLPALRAAWLHPVRALRYE
jgi:lipoprotein-releasing system permease protein